MGLMSDAGYEVVAKLARMIKGLCHGLSENCLLITCRLSLSVILNCIPQGIYSVKTGVREVTLLTTFRSLGTLV